MTPEQKARQEIDKQLEAAGWIVQDFRDLHITASLGVAVREFRLKTGNADYLLYVDAQIIGVIEAKPENHTLTGVETQSAKYMSGMPEEYPHYRLPLPFAYESTGAVTQFTNTLNPDPRSREVFTFHRPEELLRLVELETQVRGRLQQLPKLNTQRLWPVQIKAIQKLEQSLAQNRPRALIQMATGSGKTFTAASFIYRLIKFADAKRVLFLVDRANLGRQTLREFQQYVSPYNGMTFTDEYNVQHLKKNAVDPVSRVCISTIQRVYSILQGDSDFEEANEEGSMFETAWVKEPVPVGYNPSLPIEEFDFIVCDECHRSIYNLWRQVLEYFDSFIIGLTATPSKQTIGFFNNNLVMDYGHNQAVADGVNVGFDVFRIKTKVTTDGATLEGEPGLFIPHRDRRTRQQVLREVTGDYKYAGKQLDRDVVNPNQIRLVVRTFRDRMFQDMFPGRTEVPKTLVFAKDDSHADDITKIIREEFGRGNDFCQKITYRTGFVQVTKKVKDKDGKEVEKTVWEKTANLKPEEVLAEFRNSYNPRIAVTVDMISTGTDVKPLECLLFMRTINSSNYYEQMKGRGVRIIDPDALMMVTPDAKCKDRFVLVDAVGVTEQKKSDSSPIDRKPSVPLKRVLETVAKGVVDPDLSSTLAARLTRLEKGLDDDQREKLTELAGGKNISTLAQNIMTALNPDEQTNRLVEKGEVAEVDDPTEEQLDKAERELLKTAMKPFLDPKLREGILLAKSICDQVIDEVTPDELISAGYDEAAMEKAQSLVQDFQQFIEENKDELDAIRVFYSRPYRAGLSFKAVKELASAIKAPPLSADADKLWAAYRAVEPQAVKGKCGKLVDLIAIVRHAINPNQPLVPYGETVEEQYTNWLSEQEAEGVTFTSEQRQWLDAIKDHIASSLTIERDDFEYAPFTQLGGLGKAHDLFGEKLNAILAELNARLAA
ncbi:Type-1 restriction enzyme R protein [Rosistilla oblonga]|uniref:type I restriction endonuclease subunit R n=1 Tax=Rosistilla oblonga TaxID=2527990 RepID=UPI00118AA1B5|nr:DEAD/DEAH box helicase family protein [Rosistilla oblonga]QDV12239.1 Type-1 restriction enzyme R protein [Rosistilla oblonga]